MPEKNENGIDTYDHSNYSAPVQVVIGMAGFTLDKFSLVSEKLQLKLYVHLFQVEITYMCVCVCVDQVKVCSNRLRNGA